MSSHRQAGTVLAGHTFYHQRGTGRSPVYEGDMYVPAELSLPTARAIRGLKAWVTDEYEHDGLRTSNGAVLDRLLALARGTA